MDSLRKARRELEQLFGSATSDDANDANEGNSEQPSATVNTRTRIGHISGGTQHFIDNASVVNLVTSSRPKVKVHIEGGPEHIADEQKARLRALVNEVVSLETAIKRTPKRHATVWAALTTKFKCTTYHRILATDFERAQTYLMTWCARLRHAEVAPKKDANWRNSRYRYIHGVLKEIGRIEELPQILIDRYSGRKLSELSALELESVYQIVAEWKKQARRNGAI